MKQWRRRSGLDLADDPRFRALLAFYVHLILFVGTTIGLSAAHYTHGYSWWAQWVIFGWCPIVIYHGYLVMHSSSSDFSRRQDRKLREPTCKM
jgi:hypothetical protein